MAIKESDSGRFRSIGFSEHVERLLLVRSLIPADDWYLDSRERELDVALAIAATGALIHYFDQTMTDELVRRVYASGAGAGFSRRSWDRFSRLEPARDAVLIAEAFLLLDHVIEVERDFQDDRVMNEYWALLQFGDDRQWSTAIAESLNRLERAAADLQREEFHGQALTVLVETEDAILDGGARFEECRRYFLEVELTPAAEVDLAFGGLRDEIFTWRFGGHSQISESRREQAARLRMRAAELLLSVEETVELRIVTQTGVQREPEARPSPPVT